MRVSYLFKFFFFVLIITAFSLAASEDAETPAETTQSEESHGSWYTIGTWEYFSTEPPTLEYHFKHIDETLSHDLYWRWEYRWKILQKQNELKKLTITVDESVEITQDIIDLLKEQKRFSYYHYDSAFKNLKDYIVPDRIPRDLAWRMGELLGLYGGFLKESSGYVELNQNELENSQFLIYYKTSLLFFVYYLGLTETSPPIFQNIDLDAITVNSEFCADIDRRFQIEFSRIDENAWMEAIQKLDQPRLIHICELFRSFYCLAFQNRQSLPETYVSLAPRLTSIITKMMLAVQRRADFNLEAINPWFFKLYVDLNKWKDIQNQDNSPVKPDLYALLPQVQERCLYLMPENYNLSSIVEENEFAICELVRMRNYTPNTDGNEIKGEEITDEFEFSPDAIRKTFVGTLNFFHDMAYYNKGYNVDVRCFGETLTKIYNYLSGYIEIDDLSITKENALDYLLDIKMFDLLTDLWNSHYHVEYQYFLFHFGFIGFGEFHFPRTSYELRKHILKLCPQLKSYEALTLSINPQKVRDEKDDLTPDGWVDESETIRQLCIADMLHKTQYLSDVMDSSSLQGIIVGTRGISAAGKSTFLKRNILPLLLPEDSTDLLQIETLAQGILNPDTIKSIIRKLQGDTLNTQVHEEASNAFKQLLREISDKNYILDKRQLTPHDIVTNLVNPAKNAGRSVWLFDFDISLTTCITRILARPITGEDPCPEFEALLDGFLAARRHRSQVINLAIHEETISKYELYATSKQLLIAHKARCDDCPGAFNSENMLLVHDQQLFDECIKEPTIQDSEQELSQVINDSFLAAAIAKGDLEPGQLDLLKKWQGKTLKEAIQLHVQGANGNIDESLFEPPVIFPFDGNEWLEDLPQLISFLQSEHLLHVNGVDEEGRGLHWEDGLFDKKINTKYSPQAKVPGFSQTGIQMKIGYFIVPIDNLGILLSENLTPEVVREIVIRDDKGEVTDIRFFVHPTAYAHFAPLLKAGIPFVPPSKSEFMGTPTSSYNSWLIRRISTTSKIPFIVKMGAPNGSSDIKRLLAGDDIVKSLSFQKYVDKLPERSDFWFFRETAGFILKEIPGYPTGTMDSGLIIEELPDEFIRGNCKLVSLSAVMSGERIKPENYGVASLDLEQNSLQKLPLIFELIAAAIEKGLVKSPTEFLEKYFIDSYLQAIETIVFKEGYSLGVNGNNLYLVLNLDNTIKGFAYRNLESIVYKKNFLGSYSWNYRYCIFTKLLDVLIQSDSDELTSFLGAPIRIGTEKPSSERSLYNYLSKQLSSDDDLDSLEKLKSFSIIQEDGQELLKQMDTAYLNLLKKHFTFDESEILHSDGTVPCAEKGSQMERALSQKDKALWQGKIEKDMENP